MDEFYIAQQLGMLVTDMRERMSEWEFQMWLRYYRAGAMLEQAEARAAAARAG